MTVPDTARRLEALADDGAIGLGGAGGSSNWLGGLDPRLRLIAAAAFALAVVSLQQTPTLAVAFGLALLLPLTAGLSAPQLRQLLQRALPLAWLMLTLLLTLPFTVPVGEAPALFTLGALAASREGLALALMIMLKAGAVLLLLGTLAGTLAPAVLGHALGRLGAPARLTDLLLLTLRQIDLIQDEYRRLRQAMRVRGFVARADRHGLRSLGWLIGMLLVRSLARSHRVLAAMRLRGWRGRVHLLDALAWRRRDSLLLPVVLLLASVLLMFDRGLGG